MRFSDGVAIPTEGRLRIVRRFDGYYVAGRGLCIPVSSYDEGARVKGEIEGAGTPSEKK
jgi:hypothetical protein